MVAKVDVSAFFKTHKQAIRTMAITVAITALVVLGAYLAPAFLASIPIGWVISVVIIGCKMAALPLIGCIALFGVAAVAIATKFINKDDPSRTLSEEIEDFYEKEVKNVARVQMPENRSEITTYHVNAQELNKSLEEFEGFKRFFENFRHTIDNDTALKFYRDDFEKLKAKIFKAKEKLKEPYKFLSRY